MCAIFYQPPPCDRVYAIVVDFIQKGSVVAVNPRKRN
jgi:hypothetical protein